MGIWNLKISEEEKYEFGGYSLNLFQGRRLSIDKLNLVTKSDLEPNWYLLAENKISDILSECRHRIKNDSLNHKWCNKYDEQGGPYDIIIVNNGMQSTLDIKTNCLKVISLERALKTWTLNIKKSQIEKQIKNPVDYYIYCIWNMNIDMLHIIGWIERKEVIKLIENNEHDYKIPLNKLIYMKTLFLKLGIDADFAKYDDTEGQKSLDF